MSAKICIVTLSLGEGGAERSTALLSQMLSLKGYDVHIISISDSVGFEYCGELLNLGVVEGGNRFLKQLKKFYLFRRYLRKNKFDLIIDVRPRVSLIKEMVYLYFLFRGFKLLLVIHSSFTENYLTSSKWMMRKLIARSSQIISVSKFIEQKINALAGSSKAQTIYNPSFICDHSTEQIGLLPGSPYILFYGRIVDSIKNISLLIEGFKNANLPNEYRLVILGSGPDKDFLKSKVAEQNLTERVVFIPFVKNVSPFILSAQFVVLTSRYEGFPMVLVESLSMGIPVVSVDCESGPSEIIQHEYNGLLVENYKPKLLALAFSRMIHDKQLYDFCKSNAKESIRHLNIDVIAKQWDEILLRTIGDS